MATLNVNFTTSELTAATLAKQYELAGNQQQNVEALRHLLSMLNGGDRTGTLAIAVQNNATQASGTLTLSSTVATNTCAINGVTFTCESGGASGNQFNVGGSDTLTAANLASAINGSATTGVKGIITATSALGVVTVKATLPGITGNGYALAGGTNISANVSLLAGGAPDSGAVSFTF